MCALWAREGAPYDLARLRDALLSPEFVLYLGRKACPLALPLAPQIVTAGCVEDALAFLNLKQALETIAPRHGEKLARRLRDPTSWLLWDSDGETRVAVEQSVTRRDHPLSRRRWQYSVRVEHRAHLLADYAQD